MDIVATLTKARNWLTADEVSPSSRNNNYCKYYFFIVLISYVLFILISQPELSVGGDMLLEVGKNYYANAESPSWFNKLFAPDSGYIPFANRLIALVPHLLHMPAISLPYFYNWTALIIVATMTGSFCLAEFRVLIHSDLLRFCTALIVLTSAMIQARYFTGFVYFSGFFTTIMLALAAVKRDTELPRWSWFIPLLVCSKPVLLIFIPFMIFIALFSTPRFRWITYCSVALGIIQVIASFHYHQNNICWHETAEIFYHRIDDSSGIAKVYWAFLLLFKMLATLVFGSPIGAINGAVFGNFHNIISPAAEYLRIGIVSSFMLTIITMRRTNASMLSILGLAVALASFVFNNYALKICYHIVDPNWQPLPQYIFPLLKINYYKIGTDALILSIVGAFAALTKNRYELLSSLVLIAWFVLSGWLKIWVRNNSVTLSETLGGWQQMAELIDEPRIPVCVPLGKLNWLYQRHCYMMNSLVKPVSNAPWADVRIPQSYFDFKKNSTRFTITPPSSVLQSNYYLMGLMFFIMPDKIYNTVINCEAEVHLDDGKVISLFGSYPNMPSKTSLYMGVNAQHVIPTHHIKNVVLKFSVPVSMASFLDNTDPKKPKLSEPWAEWLGTDIKY